MGEENYVADRVFIGQQHHKPVYSDPDTGRRFWSEILGVGGSRPALESFVAFRGREPNIDALLRHSGMVEHAVGEAIPAS